MKLFILLCFAAFLTAAINTHNAFGFSIAKYQTKDSITYVYVCDSKTSTAYHSSPNCSGLNRCTHKVIKATIKEAVEVYGKRVCKICEK